MLVIKFLPYCENSRVANSFCPIRSARRVSAKRRAVDSSGIMSHSSLCGVVETSPKESGSRFEGSGDIVVHSEGAWPLIVRAKRRIVSVYRSEANLSTVWPSTPVCSKLIPALPLLQTMICILSYHLFVHVPT